jgi:hypothetical protein
MTEPRMALTDAARAELQAMVASLEACVPYVIRHADLKRALEAVRDKDTSDGHKLLLAYALLEADRRALAAASSP